MNHDRRPGRQQGGFTLLEVVGAGFVLSVAVLGLTATLATSGRLSESSRDEVAARYAMRGVIAQLEDSPFDNVKTAFNGRGFAIPGLEAPKGDADGLPGQILFEAGPADAPTMHRVIVRATWRSRNGVRTIESVHYLGNVRGLSATVASAETESSSETQADAETTSAEAPPPTDPPATTSDPAPTGNGNGNGKGKNK